MESEITGDTSRWDDESDSLVYAFKAERMTDPQARIAELERELQQARAWAKAWKRIAKWNWHWFGKVGTTHK